MSWLLFLCDVGRGVGRRRDVARRQGSTKFNQRDQIKPWWTDARDDSFGIPQAPVGMCVPARRVRSRWFWHTLPWFPPVQRNRQSYREQKPETQQKISAALKGKHKSSTHKENISKGLKDYWKEVPSKDRHDGTSIKDIMLWCEGVELIILL